jgi:hypothetical protein
VSSVTLGFPWRIETNPFRALGLCSLIISEEAASKFFNMWTANVFLKSIRTMKYMIHY